MGRDSSAVAAPGGRKTISLSPAGRSPGARTALARKRRVRTARRMASSRSQAVRGVIAPRFSTGIPLGRDAQRHPGAARDFAAGAPGAHRIDGTIETAPEQHGGIAGMKLADSRRAAMPGRMQARGNLHAGGELVRREGAAVRPPVPVVAAPREVERPLAGRRAPGERSVGPVGAAAREMPARLREPAAITVMSRSVRWAWRVRRCRHR